MAAKTRSLKFKCIKGQNAAGKDVYENGCVLEESLYPYRV